MGRRGCRGGMVRWTWGFTRGGVTGEAWSSAMLLTSMRIVCRKINTKTRGWTCSLMKQQRRCTELVYPQVPSPSPGGREQQHITLPQMGLLSTAI
jgi:hypothetical protein